MNVTLTRQSDDGVQCIGSLSTDGGDWRTIERGWHDNNNDISCIPTGTYRCVYTRSNRLSQVTGRDYYTYEILDVPDRTGIRIHSANFSSQLLGCVALGKSLQDLNGDGYVDAVSSKQAISEFEDEMAQQEFMLTIQ